MRARFAASVLIGALALFGASGCAFITPQATLDEVESSNGVSGDTGDVGIRNATLISDDSGATANLLVSFVNQGTDVRQLSIQYENADGETLVARVRIAAGELVSFGAHAERQLILTDIDTPAGALFPMYFQAGEAAGKELLVPVLESNWEEYEGLQPRTGIR